MASDLKVNVTAAIQEEAGSLTKLGVTRKVARVSGASEEDVTTALDALIADGKVVESSSGLDLA